MQSPARAVEGGLLAQAGTPLQQSVDTQESIVVQSSAGELGRGRAQSPRPFSQFRRDGPVRAGSTPGSARSQLTASLTAVKAAQDNANMLTLKKQLADSEDKIRQLTRAQQQADRLRDATQQRIDQKMVTMEASQPKLDRRLAELSGNYKGLSDEMQTQIRRIDAMDAKLWDWKHQMDEDVRNKLQEIHDLYQKLSSEVRVSRTTTEDSLKRLSQRISNSDKDVVVQELRDSVVDAHMRIEELERLAVAQGQMDAVVEPPRPAAPEISDANSLALMVTLDNRVSDIAAQVETLMAESHETHGRVEAQEERLRTMRTLFDTKEEHYRWLKDKVEGADYEGKLKEMHGQMTAANQMKAEAHEMVTLLHKKVEALEQNHDDFKDLVGRKLFSSQVMDFPAGRADNLPTAAVVLPPGDLPLEVRDCVQKVTDLEQKLEVIGGEVVSMRSESELAPRMAALVEQLTEVAPKVLEHEMGIRELSTKVGHMQTEMKFDRGDKSGALAESLKARIGKLEVDVETLKEAAEDNGMIPIGQDASDAVADIAGTAADLLRPPRNSRRVSATE
mmetsp:Transcript_74057/g.176339  ORF Transcript_74057/g.176339 Transcript_74057/m.176339 type:complete len:561 (+) Transcript_74057:77-1759(+)